jgi:SH3 domain-containing protein/glycosyl hydrolase family 19 (putative chitinase)
MADNNRFVVIARDGLRLRSGPSIEFNVIRTLPEGTVVKVLSREGPNGIWSLVDLEGDGQADGFMSSPFLRPADTPLLGGGLGDITGLVTPEMVKQTFPSATSLAKIRANLPFVLAGLRARQLGDRAMVLMSISTIRAETEGFVPIDEFKSSGNTQPFPNGPAFNRYEPGTPKGIRLGNTVPGDGARFKGRGYIQLTGRDNYARIGQQIGANLLGNPPLANDPSLAGLILAQFLKNKESAIRTALASGNLLEARRLVNGGSHGFDRFEDTYTKGLDILPQ